MIASDNISGTIRMKTCPKCNVTKPWVHFTKNRSKSNGYHSYCKTCNRARSKAITKTGRHRAYRAAYKARHPERYRADRILWALQQKGERHLLSRESIISDMRAGLSCPYCLEPIGQPNLSYDHKNGRGSELHPVCVECNLLKNIVTHDDFLKMIGAIGLDRLLFYKGLVARAWSRRIA